ncbi:uncharacterized protein LOC144628430 [Oculina patagonica]
MDWTTECDLLLLQEIVVSEPYRFKSSTRERGKVRDEILERLNAAELFQNRLGNKRAVRDRYTLLAKKFKKKMAEEERASGVSPEMSEQDKLLEQIVERFEESDREADENAQQGDKNKENDRKKAEEMRKRSMEKLGETRKRQAEEGGKVTPRKRASGSETLVYLREKAEREFDLRKQELQVKKDEQSAQTQMFQFMQQQLQHQQQQQQQQVQVQQQQQQLQNQLLMTLIDKINK